MSSQPYLTLWGRRALSALRGEDDFELGDCLAKLTEADFRCLVDIAADMNGAGDLAALRESAKQSAREKWEEEMNRTESFSRVIPTRATLDLIGY